jgi:multiple sugar transport system permease protein
MMARSRRGRTALIALLLSLGALATSFPFLWMIATSLKPLSESRTYPPTFLPQSPTLDAWERLFTDMDFARYLVNTLVVVAISLLGVLLIAMAGYGFAKFRFRGRNLMFLLVLATMMIPIQVTMIPTFLILNGLHLTNTLLGVALPTLVSGFTIFLARQFMTTIPDEILEAARLDGAGEARILRSIVMPMSRPILAVIGVLTFITAWNSFLWPLILATDSDNYTLSVGVSLLNRQQTVEPPLQMAGASLMVIPILLVFVVLQRHIVRGFTMSGLK